jgi:hypothetical protein
MFMLQDFFEERLDQSSADESIASAVLSLSPARPNPLTSATTLNFALPSEGPVHLAIIDVTGRKVRTLVDRSMKAGIHTLSWAGRDDLGHSVPAGIYWALLANGEIHLTRKITVIR